MVLTTIATPKPTTPIEREYHHGRKVQRRRITSHEDREFIAWDGEGINLAGTGKPQSYVLFGSTHGRITSRIGLSTFDCLAHIIDTGKRFPKAIHVGFAFGYDANMIVQSLAPSTLQRLQRNGWCRVKASDGMQYTITFAKGKFFRVTQYRSNYDAKHNPTAKTTVQIFDIFSFFATSAVKAWQGMGIEVPQHIIDGKNSRRTFTLDDWDEIVAYWEVEIQLYAKLADELRRRVYNAGLRITQWHGPGALASYVLASHNIRSHMAKTPPEVEEAARFAYAGGRFELYKVGRITGPVFGIDINSAYPHAISMLPSLVDGEWRYVENPTKLKKFGVYHVRIQSYGGFVHRPGPVFHRDKHHTVSFPWFVDGWYWSPEAFEASRVGGTVTEGWEYVGSTVRPFEWVREMYDTRRDWKRRGISAQLALKLCLNSIYGKMAQRVGWTEENQRKPPFHQLEWAGWVTSFVRARLFRVMDHIPWEALIAVETDGIYTTYNPTLLGIQHSEQLGEWEVSQYDEVMYVQSGLAWLRDGTHWTDKRRGLDPDTFTLDDCRDYLRKLHPKPNRQQPWPVYSGQTTRFIGLGQALASNRPTRERHCVWATDKREIIPGFGGKRIHVHPYCRACQNGLSAYDGPHDLVINTMAVMDPHSHPHDIPWIPMESNPTWRDYAEYNEDDMTLRMVYQ